MLFGQVLSSRMLFNWVSFGQVSFGQTLFGQVLFGQTLFGWMVFGRMSFGQKVFTYHLSNYNCQLPFFSNYVTSFELKTTNDVFGKLHEKFSSHYYKRWCPNSFQPSTISTFNNAISHQTVFSPTTPNFYKVKYYEYFLQVFFLKSTTKTFYKWFVSPSEDRKALPFKHSCAT